MARKNHTRFHLLGLFLVTTILGACQSSGLEQSFSAVVPVEGKITFSD